MYKESLIFFFLIDFFIYGFLIRNIQKLFAKIKNYDAKKMSTM